MSTKTEALQKLSSFFEGCHIRYMVIGGLANMVWGRPRLTYDAGLKILLDGRSIAGLDVWWVDGLPFAGQTPWNSHIGPTSFWCK